SFVQREEILQLMEGMLVALTPAVSDKRITTVPFPRITYADSMARYGNDKPDLRFGMEIGDLSEVVRNSGFTVFSNAVATGGSVAGIKVPGAAGYARRELDELTDTAKRYGAMGLVWMAIEGEATEGDSKWQVRSPAGKFLSGQEVDGIV